MFNDYIYIYTYIYIISLYNHDIPWQPFCWVRSLDTWLNGTRTSKSLSPNQFYNNDYHSHHEIDQHIHIHDLVHWNTIEPFHEPQWYSHLDPAIHGLSPLPERWLSQAALEGIGMEFHLAHVIGHRSVVFLVKHQEVAHLGKYSGLFTQNIVVYMV